ncbi:creatininase family protein [Anaerorhabdus sp.]|jgi:creatinine amidohydrolase|uniref:creatininase family protein n=1 Tax=Anaerorhabdus sp. TaxID=1872524 RepID=UPI002FC66330
MEKSKNIFYLNWDDASEEIKNADAVIVSIGSIEQHGHHLPLGTDTIITEKILEKITSELNCIYYPPITFGQTWSSSSFAGTVSIDDDVLTNYIINVINSINKFNPKKIILYTFHRGNEKTIVNVLRKLEDRTNLFHVEFFNIYDYVKEIVEDHIFGKTWHAGEIETSIMLYLEKDLVNLEKFNINELVDKNMISKIREVKWKTFNVSGSWGNASLANAEKGKYIFETLISKISISINEIISSK